MVLAESHIAVCSYTSATLLAMLAAMKPYIMPDDSVDPNAVKPPKYIRDAIAGLSAKDDAARAEASLRAMEKLIRGRPGDLEEIAVATATALLHVANDFCLDDFTRLRRSALIALTASCPVVVGGYLAKQVRERMG